MESQKEYLRPQLSDLPQKVTIAVIGLGPAAIHLVDELHARIGSRDTIAVFEQNSVYSYTAQASLRQFRLYQGLELLAHMVDEGVYRYSQISDELHRPVFTTFPYIMVADSDQKMAELRMNLERVQGWNLRNHFGANQMLNPDEVRKVCALIDGNIAGALYYADAGRFDFDELMQFVIKNSRNTSFYYNTRGGNIKIEHGKVVGIEVSIDGKEQFIACEKVILAPGPFLLEEKNFMASGTLLSDTSVRNIIKVKKRESFSGLVYGAPSHFKGFVIAPGGEYVSLITDVQGGGVATYGYANSSPDIERPEQIPTVGSDEFYFDVFKGLAKIMSRYSIDHKGTLTENILTRTRRSGYYVHTPDDLPLITELIPGSGLYMTGGFAGEGIMLGPAGGRIAAELVVNSLRDNPFAIRRSFVKSNDAIVF